MLGRDEQIGNLDTEGKARTGVGQYEQNPGRSFLFLKIPKKCGQKVYFESLCAPGEGRRVIYACL
jgi:hypothetical protein